MDLLKETHSIPFSDVTLDFLKMLVSALKNHQN